uniref:(northern house mosquito) hypothetical protein n=1 Tax=Culex pipiens TaxID=7175 RepID=A0A8D8DC75_CULPI
MGRPSRAAAAAAEVARAVVPPAGQSRGQSHAPCRGQNRDQSRAPSPVRGRNRAVVPDREAAPVPAVGKLRPSRESRCPVRGRIRSALLCVTEICLLGVVVRRCVCVSLSLGPYSTICLFANWK